MFRSVRNSELCFMIHLNIDIFQHLLCSPLSNFSICVLQDTVVALDALGKFAEKTFTKELNKTVTVTINGVQSDHSITDKNRYERRKFEVSVSHNQTGLSYIV